MYGLVGPNGAGKTTLLGILAGLRRPNSGSIRLEVERDRVAFAVALVAFMAALVRSVLAAAGSALAVLLLIGILGGAARVGTWLPTGLLGALGELTAGRAPGDYLPGLAVTLILIVLALTGAIRLGDRREL